MTERKCHACDTTTALRPYGPGGTWTCFPCMKATPEREAQAAAAFGALLEGALAVSPDGVAIIDAREPTSPGPQPYIEEATE